MRNEAYLWYAAVTKDAAQRRSWTFYEAVKGKQQRKVKARSLFCFWAVSELGMSLRELTRRLEMSSPGVGFSVERGQTMARENGLQLIE